jgi:hypothetical protein
MVGMVWDIIKKVLGWMWDNKNIAGYIIMAIIIAFLTWRTKSLQQKNNELTIEKGKLPDNISFIVELKDTDLKVTYRDSKDNVVFKQYYVPHEGGLKLTKFVDLKNYDPKTGLTGNTNPPSIKSPAISFNPLDAFIRKLTNKPVDSNTDVIIEPDVWGFTFRPGVAFVYDGGYNPSRPITVGLDAKMFYFYRASAGLGSTLDYPYVWASYHIDRFIPFIKVQNLEFMGGYGKPYSNFSNSILIIGGRTNF